MDYHCFLSYNSKDRIAARGLYQCLKDAGIAAWFDEEAIDPGELVPTRLQDGIARSAAGLVLIGAEGLGPWQNEEMQVLLKGAVKQDRRLIPVLLPGAPAEPDLPAFIGSRHQVDLRRGIEGPGLLRLVRVLNALGHGNQGAAVPPVTGSVAASSALPRWRGSPYPGLHALRAADECIFCGRDQESADLLKRLAEPSRPCLMVVGASGSGKSSLVWAGILPRLAAANGWRHVRFTPMEAAGGDPLAALATAMAHARDFAHCRWEAGALAAQLATPAGLGQAAEQALEGAPPGAELAIFVDQLEEVFRVPCADLKALFIERLTAAMALPRVRILATLRADFVQELPAHPGLAALYNRGNYLLSPPLRPARRQMVSEPARHAGLNLEPGLADLIVDETGDQPGALPLMAYALERLYLYERDRGRPVLSRESYLAGGGVRAAIATQADRVFAEFAARHGAPEAAAALGALFSELVRVEGADAPVTRRRAVLDRLGAADGGAARLAECLVQARLLVKDHQGAADAAARPVVDVAHEALLTGWDRLARWIAARREDLRLCDLLRRSVDDWERSGFHHTFITLGPERAQVAREALERLGQAPTELTDAFLNPVARAAWLLARDAEAWVRAGRGAVGLWDAQRFAGCADLAPGSLPEPTGAARDFLAASFAACLTTLAGDPKARAACGQALGALGDPRFDPHTWHLPADPTLGFREVPAGPFRMGTDPQREPKGWSDEEPQHDQDLPTLYVARWPVTVAQFAAFVAASGHRPADADACKGHPNHPVCYVTWHDARAYCAWHGECLRRVAAERLAALGPDPAPTLTALPVGAGCGGDAPPNPEPEPQAAARRFWQAIAAGQLQPGLPSEPEWEKAARGTDGRLYAVGNSLTPDLANYKDTGLKATCAVGCFPGGTGPYGCEDQTGNVWEWTRSLWGPDYNRVGFKYPYDAQDAREDSEAGDDLARVLRGGAFSNDSNDCRGAVRARFNPNLRYDNCGFRVVWSPLLCTLSPLNSEPLKRRKKRFGWF